MSIPPVPARSAAPGAAPGASSSTPDPGAAEHFHALVERHLAKQPAEPRQPAPRRPEPRTDHRPAQPSRGHRTRPDAHRGPGAAPEPQDRGPAAPKQSAPQPDAGTPAAHGAAVGPAGPTGAPTAGAQAVPTAAPAQASALQAQAQGPAPSPQPAGSIGAPTAGTQPARPVSSTGGRAALAGLQPPAGPRAAGPLGPAAPQPPQPSPAGAATPSRPADQTRPQASLATGVPAPGVTGGQAPVQRRGATAGAVDHGAADQAGAGPAQSAGSAPAGALPTPGADGTRPGAVADGTPVRRGAIGSPVLNQVLAEVPRLVSRGDGTHRLTLRLHPADLGELRLTVTVRNGAVDVTVAAGRAAREALRDGSPELRSLLQLTGHTAGQLVIRDLPGTGPGPAAQAWTPGGAPAAQPGGDQQATGFGQHGEPRQQQGSHAGRPEVPGHPGRDGSGPPDREPQAPAHPATRGGAAAVDVRI